MYCLICSVLKNWLCESPVLNIALMRIVKHEAEW